MRAAHIAGICCPLSPTTITMAFPKWLYTFLKEREAMATNVNSCAPSPLHMLTAYCSLKITIPTLAFWTCQARSAIRSTPTSYIRSSNQSPSSIATRTSISVDPCSVSRFSASVAKSELRPSPSFAQPRSSKLWASTPQIPSSDSTGRRLAV